MLEGERAFLLISLNLEQSGDVILPATTNAVGFVEEVLAIAQRLLRVLVDGHRDDLDVLVAVPLPRRRQLHLRESFNPRRVVGLFVDTMPASSGSFFMLPIGSVFGLMMTFLVNARSRALLAAACLATSPLELVVARG
jgi:hypothetical protein